MSTKKLTVLPGIGSSREEMLRDSGYDGPKDIATAKKTTLAARTELNPDQAEDIIEGAKFALDYDGSALNKFAKNHDIPKDQLLKGYRSIVVYGGDFDDKMTFLEKYFATRHNSLHSSSISLHLLYLLYRAGYETLEQIAKSTPKELTKVSHISTQAEDIVEEAREISPVDIDPEAELDINSSEDNQSSNHQEKHVCEGCGKEFKFERVYTKHQFRCGGDIDKSSNRNNTSGAGRTSSTDLDHINPSPLTEYYESLKSIKVALENFEPPVISQSLDDTQVQYYRTISSILSTGHPDSDAISGYGSQHSDRATHSVREYRKKHGNGDWITDYQAITTEAPDRSILNRIERDASQQNLYVRQPQPPSEDTPIPVRVTSKEELSHALWLLSQFPACPRLNLNETLGSKEMPVETIYRSELRDTKISPVDLKPPEEANSKKSSSGNKKNTSSKGEQSVSRETSPPDYNKMTSPPQRSLDPSEWKITDEIGHGGQAVIKLVELPDQKHPPRLVAIREPTFSGTIETTLLDEFLSIGDTWETIDAKEREKHRWNEYEHIVGVVDIGDEFPWIALEYMDGGDLHDQLEEYPNGLPVNQALWTGECICKALEIAHQLGLAHLDIKPENILLEETEGWPWPKVADWGIARTLAEETGTIENLSIEFAAPEQFDADKFGDPDQLTDIYQTGALMYALLTGRPPATGQSYEIMSQTMREESFKRVSKRRPEASEKIDAAVAIALERNKNDRYDSITDFRKALYALRTGGRSPPIVSDRIES